MLFHTSNHWVHRNCEQKFTKISGNNTRTTLNRFFTKTAILGTSHIIRKVLQAETWSLSGGVHHWLKGRSTREERKPVTREHNNNNNDKKKKLMKSSLILVKVDGSEPFCRIAYENGIKNKSFIKLLKIKLYLETSLRRLKPQDTGRLTLDSNFQPNASYARPHHRRQNSIVCSYC
jgi:hypothetical protein